MTTIKTTPALRKTRAQHRAELEKRTRTHSMELPGLVAERQKQKAWSANRAKQNDNGDNINPKHYKTGDGETLQPTRPGSDQAMYLPSAGVGC